MRRYSIDIIKYPEWATGVKNTYVGHPTTLTAARARAVNLLTDSRHGFFGASYYARIVVESDPYKSINVGEVMWEGNKLVWGVDKGIREVFPDGSLGKWIRTYC